MKWWYACQLEVPADEAWNEFVHRTIITRLTGGDFATGQRNTELGTSMGDFATGNRRVRVFTVLPGELFYTGEKGVILGDD